MKSKNEVYRYLNQLVKSSSIEHGVQDSTYFNLHSIEIFGMVISENSDPLWSYRSRSSFYSFVVGEYGATNLSFLNSLIKHGNIFVYRVKWITHAFVIDKYDRLIFGYRLRFSFTLLTLLILRLVMNEITLAIARRLTLTGIITDSAP